jgi:hypothetical protein
MFGIGAGGKPMLCWRNDRLGTLIDVPSTSNSSDSIAIARGGG